MCQSSAAVHLSPSPSPVKSAQNVVSGRCETTGATMLPESSRPFHAEKIAMWPRNLPRFASQMRGDIVLSSASQSKFWIPP